MRILRICVSFIAVAVMAVTLFFYISNLGKDIAPVIHCDFDEIRVSSNVTNEELLSFVTATDKEDGDLTKSVIVERGSYFISKGVSKLKYAVSDSDNNVTVLTKKMVYTDYKAPEFKLKSDLIFPRGTQGISSSIENYTTATDVIDGDISNRIKMISTELSSLVGTYKVNFKVSNHLGDYRDITVDVIVTDENYSEKPILLKEYIIYEKVGNTPDFSGNIDSLSSALSNYNIGNIQIETEEFDPTKAGVYNVYYKLYKNDGSVETMTRLIVVSEE